MANKHGALSINSENIFPIIKKWLYSDHDIFYRELISNGCDAITKLKKLDMMGEYELPEGYQAKVQVIVDPDKKTIQFIDNGVGMTADEVEEYINQIAFSGATDFIAKFIPRSWWQTRSISTRCPGRRTQSRFTGSVTAARNLTWRTASGIRSEPASRCF